MKPDDRRKEELTNELAELRQRVAELKGVEEALRRAEREKVAILGSMSEHVVYQDPTHRILWTNRAAAESVGSSSEQLEGSLCYEVWPQLSEPCVDCPVARALETGQPQQQEMITPDGRVWLIRGYPIRDEDGDVVGGVEVTLNITERVRAERDLHQLKEFNEGIVQAVAEALLIENADGIITFSNPAMEKLLGYSASELVGRHWREIVPEQEREVVLARVSQRPEGVTDRYETRLRSRDGREIPVLVSARPLFEEGTYTGVLSAFTDITERVRAEKALEKRTEELSLLYEGGRRLGRTLDLNVVYDTMHDLISRTMDCDSLCVSSYDAGDQLIRCVCVRHKGEPLDLGQFPPIPLATEGRGIQSVAIQTGESSVIADYVARLRTSQTSYFVNDDGSVHEDTPDDTERTRSAIVIPLKDDDRVVGVLQVMSARLDAYSEDDLRFLEALVRQVVAASKNAILYQQAQREISERVRVEESLRESEETTRALLNASTDAAAVLMDLDGTILALNETAAAGLKGSINELVGSCVYDRFSPGSAERQRLVLAQVVRAAEAVRFENERGGRVFDNRVFPISDARGEVARVAFFSYDITEKRRMEEELLRTEKLESIGILAGGIAHDFNNILTAIVGNIGLAKMCITPEDKIYEMLVDAEKASLRARELTRQLLTFSRGGAPIKEATSIIELIRDSATFVLRGSNVRCGFSSPTDLWTVDADQGQMSQVIQNLVINADQAMPEGGIIQIRAENVPVSAEHGLPLESGKYVKICVADEGIGISEEHLQRMFEPYFTTKQKGSGLGLATAYSIIRRHDGHICVESELGSGTTFYIYLPASEKEVPVQKAKAEQPLTGKGRILVMDDEEIVRDVAGSVLTRSGYEVEFAREGAEAIELYRQAQELGEPFAAVIMDLTIPGGMGGKEAARELLTIDPKAKVIVSSGYSTDPVMAEFRKYGFSGVVAKPYRIRQLIDVLCEVIVGSER